MRSFPVALAAAATLVLLAPQALPSAQASWLQPHTRQEAIPVAEVERALVTGKSWFEVDVDASWKHSDSHFVVGDSLFNLGVDEGTHYVMENNDGTWDYRRFELGLSWGFSRNMDIFMRVPIIWAEVWNNRMVEADGSRKPISTVGLGDMQGGFRFQWLRKQSEDGRFSTSLATSLEMRFPTGQESPGSYLGGPNNVPTIITGAGTWGFDIEARIKQQIAILAVEVGLGYLINPTNTVMYLIDDVEDQFNQHLDPGDVVHANLGLTLQFFKHLALRGDFFLDYRTPTQWGSTNAAIPACGDCAQIPGSDGFWADVQATLMADFNVRFGIDAYFRYTLGGRRNFLWPLEDLSPSRGWTAGVKVSYRF